MQINSSTENRHESNDVDTALCLHRTITCLYNINTQAQSVCHRLSWPHEVENQGRTSEGHFKRNLSRAPPQSFSFPAKASPSLEWTYGGLDFPPLNLQAIEYYMHISWHKVQQLQALTWLRTKLKSLWLVSVCKYEVDKCTKRTFTYIVPLDQITHQIMMNFFLYILCTGAYALDLFVSRHSGMCKSHTINPSAMFFFSLPLSLRIEFDLYIR